MMKLQNPVTNIIKKVKSTIDKYQMIIPYEKIVVGVSGGPDSICLLHILYRLKEELKIELIGAHFNHGLRPGEDEKETEFVKSFVESLGIPFEYGDAEKDIRKGGGSLEEKARIERYRFLENIRKRHNAQKIALGHNMNDQAETIIMRLLRGSGITGLKGIPPVRDKIIRPIIDLTREEIIYYLNTEGLKYVIDSSNMDITFLRNKIRHILIPELKKYQPNIIRILAKTAEIILLEDEFLELQTEKWVKEHVSFMEGAAIIPLSRLKEIHIALRQRVIRNIIRKKIGHTRKISFEHISNILELIEKGSPNSEIHLPYNIVIKKRYDLLICDEKRSLEDYSYIIDRIGEYYLPSIKSWIKIEEKEKLGDLNESDVLLDAEKIDFPLEIRNIRPGDRIYLSIGHKKIKDIFIDMKIPKEARKSIPILVNKGIPIYIWCIKKMDRRFAPKKDSKKILKISIKMEKMPFWKKIYGRNK